MTKIIQDVDALLTKLSEEYSVPVPNFCIYKVEEIKPLDGWKDEDGISTMKNPLPFSAGFCHFENTKLCYIIFLMKNNRINKSDVVHEWFHYLHYINGGTSEDVEIEERLTKRQTKEYMKRLK